MKTSGPQVTTAEIALPATAPQPGSQQPSATMALPATAQAAMKTNALLATTVAIVQPAIAQAPGLQPTLATALLALRIARAVMKINVQATIGRGNVHSVTPQPPGLVEALTILGFQVVRAATKANVLQVTSAATVPHATAQVPGLRQISVIAASQAVVQPATRKTDQPVTLAVSVLPVTVPAPGNLPPSITRLLALRIARAATAVHLLTLVGSVRSAILRVHGPLSASILTTTSQ